MLTKPAPTGKTLTNKQKKLTLCRKKGNLPDGAQTTKQKTMMVKMCPALAREI